MSIENEYIRIEEVAKRLGLSPKSVRNKMSNGIFKRGVHFFKPIGITPRFSWSAIEKWMREEPTAGDTKNDDDAKARDAADAIEPPSESPKLRNTG